MVQERPLSVHITRHFLANFAAERGVLCIVSVKKPTALEIYIHSVPCRISDFLYISGTLQNNILFKVPRYAEIAWCPLQDSVIIACMSCKWFGRQADLHFCIFFLWYLRGGNLHLLCQIPPPFFLFFHRIQIISCEESAFASLHSYSVEQKKRMN